jgi:predicted acyl esterase
MPFVGSSVEYSVALTSDVMVPVRDGTCLATDVYQPAAADGRRFPCILMRTPYDKSLSHKTGSFFARRGYVCARLGRRVI